MGWQGVFTDIGCRQIYGVITKVDGNSFFVKEIDRGPNSFRGSYTSLLASDLKVQKKYLL